MWRGRLQWGCGISCHLPDCHVWIIPAPPAFAPWKSTSVIFIHQEFTVHCSLKILTQETLLHIQQFKSNSTVQILLTTSETQYQYQQAIYFFGGGADTSCFKHQWPSLFMLVLIGIVQGIRSWYILQWNFSQSFFIPRIPLRSSYLIFNPNIYLELHLQFGPWCSFPIF